MPEIPDLEIKVVKIKHRWHARLLVQGKLHEESACELKEDIGFMCREMLRWFDKLGGISKLASSSRRRQNRSKAPVGRIWCYSELVEERKVRKGFAQKPIKI